MAQNAIPDALANAYIGRSSEGSHQYKKRMQKKKMAANKDRDGNQ